jgi:ribosomal protein S18 acetylase RimI-like enzyme
MPPETPPIAIRRLAPEDAALAAAAAPDVFDTAPEPHALAAFLADPRHILIVALAGEQVVGQIQAHLHTHPDLPADLFLDNLGVTPAWQRRGVARRLLAAALAAGREAGAAEAWVLAETDNPAACALYAAAATSARGVRMFSFDLAAADTRGAS